VVLGGIRGCLGCIWCQKRLRLSSEVDECKPLPWSLTPSGGRWINCHHHHHHWERKMKWRRWRRGTESRRRERRPTRPRRGERIL